MGIRNVIAACYVEPDKLSGELRTTLVVMATISLDSGPDARLYFGGWRLVMIRQGRFPDEAAKKRFIAHVARLRSLGLLEVAKPAAHGKHATYRLLLPVDNFPFLVDNSADSVEEEDS